MYLSFLLIPSLVSVSLSGLSRALSHLAEVEEKVEQVHVEQANGDFYQLSETIRDYVALLGAVKVFD